MKILRGGEKGSVVLILLLLGMALMVGMLAIDTAEERAPAMVMAGLCIVGALLWVRRIASDDQFQVLFRFFMLAFVLRIFVSVSVHYMAEYGLFAMDDYFYDILGNHISKIWHGEYYGNIQSSLAAQQKVIGHEVGYAYLVAFFYYIFGRAPLVCKVFNCFVGSMTVIYFTKYAWEICGKRTAKLTGFFCAVFPSMVLWSGLQLKDPIASFCIIYAVYMSYVAQRSFSMVAVFKIVVALVVLGQMRGYMFILVGGSIGMSFFIRQFKHAIRNSVLGFFMIAAAFFLFQYFGFGKQYTQQASFENLQNYRSSLTGGGSSIHMDADVSSPGKALIFLPIGLTYFLFAPFPWAVSGMRQIFALPEVLIWYALFAFFVRGILMAFRENFKDFSPAVSSMLLVSLTYSLVEGNLGTAYRHRSQVFGFYLLFTAMGLARYIEQRQKNREVTVKTPRALLSRGELSYKTR